MTLQAGVPVMANLLSASRDERIFADPDRYDVRRGDGRPIPFGAGIHYCLGAALARATVQEGVRALVRGAVGDRPCRTLHVVGVPELA